MTAGLYNLTIEQGATFAPPAFTYEEKDANGDWNPIDITGYTARMHVRARHDSAATIVELTTENGRIALGGAAGTIALTIADSVTEALTPGDYVYDLELESAAGGVTRLLEGAAVVTREVTR